MTRFAGFASRLGHNRLRVGIRAQPPPRTLHRFSIALRFCTSMPSSTVRALPDGGHRHRSHLVVPAPGTNPAPASRNPAQERPRSTTALSPSLVRRHLPRLVRSGAEMKQTVEIVGAGIAGLTTGLAFAQKGWRVRVHEQRNALCNRREGIFVWENGLRVLDALGVLTPTIAGAGGSARYERRNHDDKTFSSGRLGGDLRLYVVLRETLVSTLRDALVETGGEVVFNSRGRGAARRLPAPCRWQHAARRPRRCRRWRELFDPGQPRTTEVAAPRQPIRLLHGDSARAERARRRSRMHPLRVLEWIAATALCALLNRLGACPTNLADGRQSGQHSLGGPPFLA